jgi:hypothetical protein
MSYSKVVKVFDINYFDMTHLSSQEKKQNIESIKYQFSEHKLKTQYEEIFSE